MQFLILHYIIRLFYFSIYLFQLCPGHNWRLWWLVLIQLDSIVRIALSHSFTIIACNPFSQQSKQIHRVN